jgi:hypothetical protein
MAFNLNAENIQNGPSVIVEGPSGIIATEILLPPVLKVDERNAIIPIFAYGIYEPYILIQ